jgi:hypothetical protein
VYPRRHALDEVLGVRLDYYLSDTDQFRQAVVGSVAEAEWSAAVQEFIDPQVPRLLLLRPRVNGTTLPTVSSRRSLAQTK